MPDLDTCYRLLPRVSRTFALNIRILPGGLRPATTVAYLLFRIVDTIEDAPGLCTEDRTVLFDAILDRLDGGGALELPSEAAMHLRETITEDERALLEEAEAVFRAFERLPESAREIVSAHVSETARGMERIARERTRDGLLALENWKDLDEYCYYVAGTIGIMLTRLFAAHTSYLDGRSERHLMALGTNFGRGLQLTNILKGVRSDRGEGRVFLPRDLLLRHGTTPETVAAPDSRAALRAASDEVVGRALQDLEDALRYTLLLPRREPLIRLFCLWPLFTAVRTLAVVAATPDDQAEPPKISRGELYWEMTLSALQVFSNGQLRRRFGRLRRTLFPARPRREVWAGS